VIIVLFGPWFRLSICPAVVSAAADVGSVPCRSLSILAAVTETLKMFCMGIEEESRSAAFYARNGSESSQLLLIFGNTKSQRGKKHLRSWGSNETKTTKNKLPEAPTSTT
jgi:hypothetical protein